jgi:ABC-2 type transport system permease protein
MSKLRRLVWLYLRSLGAHIRAAMQYEADFWILVVAAMLMQAVGVVFLGAVFARIPRLNGWSFWDVVLIYAMVTIAEGIGSLFFEGTWRLSRRVNLGELDYALVRPYPVVLQVMSSDIGLNGAGNLVTGGILLGLGLAHVDLHWTFATVALTVVLMISAILVKLAISLGTNAAAFWIAGPYNTFAYAMHQVGELARYPITIYATGVRVAIGLLIPFAFVSFFPISALLGRGSWAWLGFLTPLAAAYCVLVTALVFRRGLRRYESTGN